MVELMTRNLRIAVLPLVMAIGLAIPALAGGDPFLWEVEGEGAKAYLLGSLHFATEDVYPLDPAIGDDL